MAFTSLTFFPPFISFPSFPLHHKLCFSDLPHFAFLKFFGVFSFLSLKGHPLPLLPLTLSGLTGQNPARPLSPRCYPDACLVSLQIFSFQRLSGEGERNATRQVEGAYKHQPPTGLGDKEIKYCCFLCQATGLSLN